MPTYAEKMIWSFGDGSPLCVYDTQIGRLGTLCCGENTNPLARFALIAQGEQIHVANYPARPAGDAVDLRYNIQIRSAAHAFEGNCFVVAAGSLISREMRERLGDTAEKRKLLGDGSQTFTGVLGPDGKVIAGPAADDTEAIVYGSIDLEVIVRQKIHHDVAGNYNRFDVLSLVLNRAPLTAIREIPAPPVEPPAAEATPQTAERAHEPIIFDSRSSGPSALPDNLSQSRDAAARPVHRHEKEADVFSTSIRTAPARDRQGLRSHILLETHDGADSDLTVTWVDVQPGAQQQPHSHAPQQVYVIVNGRGRMHVEDEERDLAAGDLVFIPPGATPGVPQFVGT